MQSRGPPPVLRNAAFEFVNHFDYTVLHDVIVVSLKQRVRVQRVLDRGMDREVTALKKIAAPEGAFDGPDTGVSQRDIVAPRINREVFARAIPAHHLIGDVGETALA